MTSRVIVGNLGQAVRSGPPKHRVQQVLQAIEEQFDPDVFLLCETNGIRPAKMLGKATWRGHQGRLLGRGNNAVVWDRDHTYRKGHYWIGTWPLGHVLEPRWINRARVAGSGWTIVHIPPLRDQELVPGMLRNMSRHTYSPNLTWGGDRNQADMRAWAASHGYHYRETEVMFLASDKPIHRFRAVEFAGFDHPFLVADVGRE